MLVKAQTKPLFCKGVRAAARMFVSLGLSPTSKTASSSLWVCLSETGLVHKVPSSRPYRARCGRSEEHTSELQSRGHLVCRLLLEKKNKTIIHICKLYTFDDYSIKYNAL